MITEKYLKERAKWTEVYRIEKSRDASALVTERRQAQLKALFENGDMTVKRCLCGRFFLKKINGPRGREGMEKRHCYKCPMKNKTI